MKVLNIFLIVLIAVLGAGAAWYVATVKMPVVASHEGHEHGKSDEHADEEKHDHAPGEEHHEDENHKGGADNSHGEDNHKHAPGEEHKDEDGHVHAPGEEHDDEDHHDHGPGDDHAEEQGHSIPATTTPTSPNNAKPVVEGATPQEEHGHTETDEHGHVHEHEEGQVKLTEASAREAGLEVGTAAAGTLSSSVTLPGEIALDPNRVVHVVPRLSGVAPQVFKKVGDQVQKGEVLAVIDSAELADAQSSYLAALERRELARARYNREKNLFEQKISPEDDYLSAKQALAEEEINVRTSEQKLRSLGLTPEQFRSSKDASMTHYPVASPVAGTIIEKHLSIGEAVQNDADAFVIADLSSVWADVTVYAADLGRVRQGQPVRVHSQDLGLTVESTISYIGALVGEQTRTARAVVEISNPDGLWRPGLFVTVTLADEPVSAGVVVPVAAIQTLKNQEVVFVKEGTTYNAHPIKRGRTDGKQVEIVEGLDAGDVYVTQNSFLIKADIEKAGAAHEH